MFNIKRSEIAGFFPTHVHTQWKETNKAVVLDPLKTDCDPVISPKIGEIITQYSVKLGLG